MQKRKRNSRMEPIKQAPFAFLVGQVYIKRLRVITQGSESRRQSISITRPEIFFLKKQTHFHQRKIKKETPIRVQIHRKNIWFKENLRRGLEADWTELVQGVAELTALERLITSLRKFAITIRLRFVQNLNQTITGNGLYPNLNLQRCNK